MEYYNKIKACFDENGCTLITTLDEFEELRKLVRKQYYQYVRIRFTGSCSHESSAVFTNFYLRKTGIICKACTIKNSIKLTKEATNSNEIESDGIEIIKEYLTPYYDVIRTKEGCLADIAIKQKSIQIDQWIPIQVKTTMNISHGMYSFTLNHKNYENMLIICVCISEKKIWVLPYNHINTKYKLNISVRSKYSKYLVTTDTIKTSVDTYLSDIVYMTMDNTLMPISKFQQQEQVYVKRREQSIPFLRYEYPIIQNTCVDVIINGKKVQEKVLGYIETKNALYCGLSANNGTINGKRQYRCYRLGENKYYWLHSSIDERFWIIPEQILYEKGYISNINETNRKRTLWFKSDDNVTNEWINSYLYSYDAINRETLLKLFE